mmetsp:Transcript_289/g.314  ORF Transcript_289/g.314 Transcript_289/m.314 type:complete len:355 (+) Transcript_289:281-1345(+)|eukprot:CAMPEP_0170543144 /NCGR_PEP_ID=MMETSP0211-20121228/2354_1 /TAXON_ID=311385 /ORGANISM="Pseudokeronopsis sp., Strain OXSARD2" /LENGTH=354 /DNA_ID=CAMNT_0010846445 /DNA_START=272 /DNA_END=1336 /DNA_ORIENTATION=+
MESEQIMGVYKFLEIAPSIYHIALWSCFFNYKEMQKKMSSELMEDSMVLKQAANTFVEQFTRQDKSFNSPIRSKYLSQNYLENYLFIEATCKNMRVTQTLRSITFCGIRLSMDSMKILNESLLPNKLVRSVSFNFCLLDLPLLEAIMPAFCQSTSIETINLSCNGLTDKCSYLMAKIISAQSERRDNVVWSYSLRGEVPPGNEYKKGLKEIILSYNNFQDILASEIILALRNDLYLRSVDLRNNNIGEKQVMEFLKLFDTNNSLTNLDLRENDGFNAKYHRQLALKLLKNIYKVKDAGELENDQESDEMSCPSHRVSRSHSRDDLNSKYIKSEILTVEIPKKLLDKFSCKIKHI